MKVVEELQSALDEAVSTIELGPVLGQDLVKKRLARYRVLAHAQAPLVADKPHRTSAFQKYIAQLEDLARKIIEDGGPRAEEAALVISKENLVVLGLAEEKPITGSFTRVSINRPSLDDPCPHKARNGHHERYIDGRREYCRACGAEKLVRAQHP